jgi:hypothetical protein
VPKPHHIGIVACSAEGGRCAIAPSARKGRRFSVRTPWFSDCVRRLDRDDLRGVYPDALGARGLSRVRPGRDTCEEVSRIILDELVKGIVLPESVAYLASVIDDLKSRGCDAVVLGCTELPLVLDDRNAPLPTLDSTRLLALAALPTAIGGEDPR